jgi:hypothetical protein
MKNSLLFASLLVTAFMTAMDNPGAVNPAQHISLLQSFLLATDFKVTQDNKVTYPHYKYHNVLFSHARQDATALLWEAHGSGINNKENDQQCLKIVMELYDQLDRTQPLEPQITLDNKLLLQKFIFGSFFAHKDTDKNDDIVITSKGVKTLVTAQQKHAMAEYRKSLEDFLMKLSSTGILPQAPRAPEIDLKGIACIPDYLTSRFNFMDQVPPEFIEAFRRCALQNENLK